MTQNNSQLPASLTIGKSILRLDEDAAFTLMFIDGFQAGKLQYQVRGKKVKAHDTDLILMIVARQNASHHTQAYQAGFVLGNLSALMQKSVFLLTHTGFIEGMHEGIHTYAALSKRHVFTASELCSLFAWKQDSKSRVYQAGLITGFVQGLTDGVKVAKGAK